jgi:hypothetical protein
MYQKREAEKQSIYKELTGLNTEQINAKLDEYERA